MLKSEIEKLTDMQKFNLLTENYHKLRKLMDECKTLITDCDKLYDFIEARYGETPAIGDTEYKLTDSALPIILPMTCKGATYSKTLKQIPPDPTPPPSVTKI